MAAKNKEELIKKWAEKNNISGDNPWFDKNTTYYNLTTDQIIRLSTYLKQNS